MATVNGTSGNDFIHVAGDGLIPPAGYTDNAGATNGVDTINSGHGGSDIIFAGGGDDTINFGDDLDASDKVNGGDGSDTLTINDQTDITFAADSLTSVEVIALPFIVLQIGFAGFQNLTMNDGNVAAGKSLFVNAGAVGDHVFFTFDGSAETDGSFDIIGGAGADHIKGGQAGNSFDMENGGDDFVQGGAGNDDFFFGDTLTAADTVIAGGGDGIVIDGPSYAAGLTFGATTLSTSGSTILYGPTHSYKLILNDANIAAGTTLHVQPNGTPSATQTLFFDASAEKNGAVDVQGMDGNDTLIGSHGNDFLGGHGGNDQITMGAGLDSVLGGDGDDRIIADAQLSAADRIDGGTGNDTLTLKGDYSAGLVFTNSTLINVEKITLAPGHSYNLTTNDATVAAGADMTVDGSKLGAADSLTFNGSAERDGAFLIKGGKGEDTITGGRNIDALIGGGGQDTLNGGLGADHFVYTAASDSTGVNYDIVKGADFTADKWDVPGTITAIDPAIVHGALSVASFDSDLAAAADPAHLGAHHAVLFTPDSGGLSGKTFLVIDTSGAAGYQAGADLVVQLSKPLNLASLDAHDFI